MTHKRFVRNGRSRTSVLAAIAIILPPAIVGALLYSYEGPNPFSATAQFLVSPDKPSFLDAPDLDYKRRNEIFRKTQADCIRSNSVILSALREPGIGSLAILAPHDDKVLWIQTNLDVQYIAADVDDDQDGLIDDDSRVLQIQLHGPEDHSEDFRKIVGAIGSAYLRDVVYKDQQREANARYEQQEAIAKLRKKIVQLIEERDGLKEHSPEAVAEIHVAEIEIDQLTTVFRHLIDNLELRDFASATGTVRQLQSVVVAPVQEPATGFVRGLGGRR